LKPDLRKEAEDDYVIALQRSTKPKMCNFAVTLGCMLRCKICHHWQYDERGVARPGVAAWKQFFSSLRGEVATDFTIVFGGGEPLKYPAELLELISCAAGLGFRTALATSGHTIDKKYAKALVASGLSNIDLTILSLDRAVHDSLRGVRGSLARVLRAIDYLSSSSDTLDIGINALITKPALAGLVTLSEWVHNRRRLSGIHFQAITRPFHTPFVESWHTTEQYRFLWPDDLNQLESVIDALICLKQQGCRISNPVPQFLMFKSFFKSPDDFVKPFTCNLVSGGFFAADADGTVKLCPYMQPLGKITDGDFRQLWHSEHAESAKAQVGRCKQNCHHLINCWYEEG
jgi:MoaA/NifB/PqqE/SkfB family radical SAM enzyme